MTDGGHDIEHWEDAEAATLKRAPRPLIPTARWITIMKKNDPKKLRA
jgi:hypothetical protein